MSIQDRYIDARLAGIEDKLDARMEAMQRFQEQADARMREDHAKAEARFERAEERIDARVSELAEEMRTTRRHASAMSLATIAAVVATLAIAGTFITSQFSEQGAWLRDSVNRIEQRIESMESRPAASSTASSTSADQEAPPPEQP